MNDLGISAVFRCDSCQAQAFSAATMNDLMLFFCGHHFNRHADALDSEGWTAYDRTHLITRAPANA